MLEESKESLGDSQTRPGDVFHPDYSDGRPTFFDLSVRNTLQLATINHASSTVGVAAECRKDEKHRALVERSGAVFVPWAPWSVDPIC